MKTFISAKSSFVIVNLALILTTYHSTAYALCAERTNFAGAWNSIWESPTGKYNSRLDINLSGNGIQGHYDNGTFSGTYIGGNKHYVEGYWKRTQGNSGGACQFGRFRFTLKGGQILGSWSYCNDSPTWGWNATMVCNDVIQNPVDGEQSFSSENTSPKPTCNISGRLIGGDHKYWTVSIRQGRNVSQSVSVESDGSYSFIGISQGKYEISADTRGDMGWGFKPEQPSIDCVGSVNINFHKK